MAEPSDKPRLEALHDRRRSVRIGPLEHAYSAVVRRLRRILPLLALMIVAALMIWPRIETMLAERRFAPSTLDKAALQQAATENRLLNANFSSVDSRGRPFTMVATEAVQDNANPDIVLLQNPSGTLRLDTETLMTAEARNGIYGQEKQHLTLNDDVVITRSDGTTLKTQTLFIDLATQDTHTEAPVTIDGPDGRLTAQGMTTKDSGAVTVFPGPAKLILNSKSSIDPQRGT